MWKRLAAFVIKHRLPLLLALSVCTVLMAVLASKVKLSYEFAKAIPPTDPKYIEYQSFRQRFGDDGNLLVIALKTDHFFSLPVFSSVQLLEDSLKKIKGVEGVQSVTGAFNLIKDTVSGKLKAVNIFSGSYTSQQQIDSASRVFYSLPIYRGLLYNNNVYIIGLSINKDLLNSSARTAIVNNIIHQTDLFSAKTNIPTFQSGLPLIRTLVADRISKEMKWFLLGSLLLSALILLIFFRSLSTMLLSLSVVIISVIWSFGVLYLLGYKITLLTALIPPLIVVIGIPNCIYFLNKYHTGFRTTADKYLSLVDMVSKMGVVTFFCNLTAAIGFAVFALTDSAILKEFGMVAGISIMLIFLISFILLPAVLSYLPPATEAQTKYLNNRYFTDFLSLLERIVFNYQKWVYIITATVLLVAFFGILRLKTEAHIVDDLPKKDKIYTDLKFFEQNFKGVMPLEIVIDTKRKYGLAGMRALTVFAKMDSLSDFINNLPQTSRPLSVVEGLKFAKQAFYDGDSTNYVLPNAFDGAFVADYLKVRSDSNSGNNNFSRLIRKFIDSAKQSTRMSINMADVGTIKLPMILNAIHGRANKLFDSSNYSVHYTGTSVTFLEGSKFIINGLKDSIFWAFLLICLCMLYLFRSFRILICCIIPNVIPLVITAGVMGWAGISLKPSTVLIFSVALGIAIDVTIRFLVNYKQELPVFMAHTKKTVSSTIRHTGLSILYTSIVLIIGFIIFCFSSFGGTQALGWLTSLTLFTATLTNLILLPVLLIAVQKR